MSFGRKLIGRQTFGRHAVSTTDRLIFGRHDVEVRLVTCFPKVDKMSVDQNFSRPNVSRQNFSRQNGFRRNDVQTCLTADPEIEGSNLAADV